MKARKKVLRVEESTVFPSRPWWAMLECGHRVSVKSREVRTARCRRCELRKVADGRGTND